MIKWDRSEMARLNRAMRESLKEAAGDLDKEIKDAQVIPRDTGALERSQRVEVTDDTITVSYDAPHAARVYYHPEMNFDRSKNRNAKGLWLNDFVDDVPKLYGKHLKEKV